MKRLLLLLFLLIPLPVHAMPIAGNMVAKVDDMEIKSINGNLFEIRKDGKVKIERLIQNKDNTYSPVSDLKTKFNMGRLRKEIKVVFPDLNKTEKILEGEIIDIPKKVKKEGYVFKGWDKDVSEIKSNTEIKAIWEPKVYNVTFKDNEKVISTQKAEYGKEAKAPEMQDEAERSFAGWDKDLIIKEDTVINAKWNNKKYHVTFIDDLHNKTTEQYIEYMNNATPPMLNDVPGYEFVGWDKDTKEIIDDEEIHAVWKQKNGTIQYSTVRKPKENKSVKLKTEEVMTLVRNDETGKVYGDYNILQKTRDSINSKYFYYFSILDSSLKEDNKGFYLEINPSKERLDKNEYINNKVNEITHSIMKEGMQEVDGIKALNNWFKNNFSYKAGMHNLYDVLKNSEGNCDAYAQLTQAICDCAGIECKYVTGYIPEGYHAWNRIKLNNTWYYADFTHDKKLSENIWQGYDIDNEKYYFDKAN